MQLTSPLNAQIRSSMSYKRYAIDVAFTEWDCLVWSIVLILIDMLLWWMITCVRLVLSVPPKKTCCVCRWRWQAVSWREYSWGEKSRYELSLDHQSLPLLAARKEILASQLCIVSCKTTTKTLPSMASWNCPNVFEPCRGCACRVCAWGNSRSRSSPNCLWLPKLSISMLSRYVCQLYAQAIRIVSDALSTWIWISEPWEIALLYLHLTLSQFFPMQRQHLRQRPLQVNFLIGSTFSFLIRVEAYQADKESKKYETEWSWQSLTRDTHLLKDLPSDSQSFVC